MEIHIVNNLVSYHDLAGHQPRSQGFFSNAKQLISFLFQSITLHLERSTGNEAEWACIIAEFLNSIRTNSFQMVESRESSSYSIKKNIQAKG